MIRVVVRVGLAGRETFRRHRQREFTSKCEGRGNKIKVDYDEEQEDGPELLKVSRKRSDSVTLQSRQAARQSKRKLPASKVPVTIWSWEVGKEDGRGGRGVNDVRGVLSGMTIRFLVKSTQGHVQPNLMIGTRV